MPRLSKGFSAPRVIGLALVIGHLAVSVSCEESLKLRSSVALEQLPEADDVFQAIAVKAAEKVPVVGELLSFVLDLFWPSGDEEQTDVWEDIHERVQDLIEDNNIRNIRNMLNGLENRVRDFDNFQTDTYLALIVGECRSLRPFVVYDESKTPTDEAPYVGNYGQQKLLLDYAMVLAYVELTALQTQALVYRELPVGDGSWKPSYEEAVDEAIEFWSTHFEAHVPELIAHRQSFVQTQSGTLDQTCSCLPRECACSGRCPPPTNCGFVCIGPLFCNPQLADYRVRDTFTNTELYSRFGGTTEDYRCNTCPLPPSQHDLMANNAKEELAAKIREAFASMQRSVLESFRVTYFVNPEPLTWADAEAYCRTIGRSLVRVDSPTVRADVWGLVDAALNADAWIGLSDIDGEGIFTWSDDKDPYYYANDSMSPAPVTFWGGGEPNNAYNNEDCVLMWHFAHVLWNDAECSQTRPSICGPQARFVVVDTPMRWEDARDHCRSLGRELVRVDDAEKRYSLASFLVERGYDNNMWIGLSDLSREGTFAWSDDDESYWSASNSSAFTWWGGGEPNNAGGYEDCVAVWAWADSRWNDAACWDPRPSICGPIRLL